MFSLVPICVEHPQHRLVRAAVQRAVERGHAGGHGRVRIDLRGADPAHRVGRAVLLVVGVKNPEDVEGALEPRVGLVLHLGHLEHHREEVAGVGQVVVRIHVREPEVVPVREGGERRHLRDQPDRGHVTLELVVDPLRLRIEGRERADGGEQHAHRVGVVAEALHELLDVLVDEGVVGDLEDPLVELLLGRQRAVDQEIGDLEVRGLLAELVDRIAAVLENPGLAVDVTDRAAHRRRVRERRVIGHEAEVVLGHLDLAKVHRLDGAVRDLDVVALAGAVVRDAERLVRRGHSAAVLALCLLVSHISPSFPRL